MSKKDMNSVVLIGTLTREPEIKYTPTGTCIASIAIANNQSYTVKNEVKVTVSYFSVTAYGQTAVNVQKYLKKGNKIAVIGSLRQDRWTDKATGKTASKISVVAEMIQFLSAPAAAPQGQTASQPQNTAQNPYAPNGVNQPTTPPQYQQPQGRSPTTPPPAQPYDPLEEEGHYGVLSAPSDNFSYDEDIPF